MLIQLFLLLICISSESIASHLEPDKSVCVTIDDHYSDLSCFTVTIKENPIDPSPGAKEYRLIAQLQNNNEWDVQYLETVHMISRYNKQLYPKEKRISQSKMPQSKLQTWNRLLNEAGWRHMYLYSADQRHTTTKQLCSNWPQWAQTCKEPLEWLKAVATQSRTVWVGKIKAHHLACMDYFTVFERNYEAQCLKFEALYEKTKSPADATALKKVKDYKCSSNCLKNELMNSLTSSFPFWRTGVLQEIKEHEERDAEKKRDEEATKKNDKKTSNKAVLVKLKEENLILKRKLKEMDARQAQPKPGNQSVLK